jgi:hypothetical protein
MNPTGLYAGLFMLFSIGSGFFWVIRVEYHLGAGVWKAVLALGLILVALSAFMPSFTASAALGIFGGSVVWGATELPSQEDRVRRGLFPANPKRKSREEG